MPAITRSRIRSRSNSSDRSQYVKEESAGGQDDWQVAFLVRRGQPQPGRPLGEPGTRPANHPRSEEHTSELQSLAYLVCRLLLEKKKQQHVYDDFVLLN